MKVKFSISPFAPICWAGAAVMMTPERYACFAAALAVHEAAHLAAMKARGVGVTAVRVCPAGLEITRGDGGSSYAADAAVSLSGPAASVVTGGACIAAGGLFRVYGIFSLILGVLNALPIYGLDGGYALRSILLGRISAERAERASRAVSLAATFVMWVFSVWIMLVTDGSFTLFALSCALFAAQAF